jgi:hypothetical protein
MLSRRLCLDLYTVVPFVSQSNSIGSNYTRPPNLDSKLDPATESNCNMIVLVPTNACTETCIRRENYGSKVALPLPPRRSVRFSEDEIVHVLPSFEPFTNRELRALWYQKKDYARFSTSDRTKAKDYRYAKRTGSDHAVDVRGLENQLTLRASLDARNRIFSSRQAVMDEQERQRKQGARTLNPHLIREVSLATTKSSRVMAYNLAKLDTMGSGTAASGNNQSVSRISGDRSMSLDVPPEKPQRRSEYRRVQSCFVLI